MTAPTPVRVPFLLPQWLPGHFGGRAVAFVPDSVRRVRNLAFYLVLIEVIVDLASLPIGAARGGLSKASSGIHGVLLVVSLIEWIGLLRLSLPLLLFGGVLAAGIPAIFALFMILTLTVSQGGTNPDDAIVILIFISLVLDFVAGLCSLATAVLLNSYARQAAREDAAFAAQVVADLRTAGTVVSTGGTPGHAANPLLPDADTPTAGSRAPQPGSPAPWEQRHRGVQQIYSGGGYVLPPNAGTSILPLIVLAGAAPGVATDTDAEAHAVVVPLGPAAPSREAACDICMSRQRDTAFVPCGHLACAACAHTVRTRMGKCHLCRRPIRETLRVYIG